MSFRSPARFIGITAAAAVGVSMTMLTAPTAQAAPVFVDAQTQIVPNSQLYTDTIDNPDCSTTDPGTPEAAVAVVENGPAASVATAVSGSYANAGNVADTATGAGSASGSGKVTSVAGNLSTMDFSVQSTATLNQALVTSADCFRGASADVALNFQFVVTQPGFLTLESKGAGSSAGGITVYRVTTGADNAAVQSGGNGAKFTAETKVYLAAGTYAGTFQGGSSVFDTSGTTSGTSSVHASFAVAGSQTEAVSGKAKKYVTTPAARSCATDTLVPTITKKKNRANKIQQITFFINDKKVEKVKKIKKGAEVKLSVADDVTADLVAEVKLFPAKKGQASKVIELSASYEACS